VGLHLRPAAVRGRAASSTTRRRGADARADPLWRGSVPARRGVLPDPARDLPGRLRAPVVILRLGLHLYRAFVPLTRQTGLRYA